MHTLDTWAGRSSFSYTGSVRTGTKLTYGAGWTTNVTADQYAALLTYFRGRTVNIGTSRTDPPKDSVGEWLIENVTKTGIASYIGPILIAEGYAAKGERAEIRFNNAYPS
ncbi:MAG: hypothetical protein Q8P50_15405 [Bacillota bacterium]|nr:hypothetical protein [Bacillota bacterium]